MSEHQSPAPRSYLYRVPLLVCGAAALIVGICTGLTRIGVNAPLGSLAELHGPLLICGFFGTLTGLERAVAVRSLSAYLPPFLCAAGTILVLSGAITAGAACFLVAAFAVSAAALSELFRKRSLFTVALAGSALSWLAGNLIWSLGASVPEASGWWLAFIVLVIGGERLEFGRPRPQGALFTGMFVVSLSLLACGSVEGIAEPRGGLLFGAGLVSCAVWMGWHDARLCLSRRSGTGRFMSVNLAAGYLWLGVGGMVQIADVAGLSVFSYDMTIHAVVVGFALSMVFGHALLVFPIIFRTELVYSPALYLPFIVLQIAVALRIAGGAMQWDVVRMVSGSMTAFAIFCFAAIVAGTALKARYTRRQIRRPVRA